MNSLSRAASGSLRSVATTTSHGIKAASHTIQNGTAAAGRGVVGTMTTVAETPGHAVKFVSNAAAMGSLVRPEDKTPVPVITPVGNAAAVQSVSKAAPPSDPAAAQWPIHGAITTPFGVPEWPYERIHTGLDISDGKAPGVTPVKPFRPGRVVGVIHSGGGLGNHVIIDHGGGVTSVYGHLYSIAVQTGQQIGETTILGYEGSTGASTGTHLHFEIRVNGQPKDPLKFISGHP